MSGEKAFDQACTGVVEGSPPAGGEKQKAEQMGATTKGLPPQMQGKMYLSLTLAHDTLHALTQFFNRVAFVDKLQNRSE